MNRTRRAFFSLLVLGLILVGVHVIVNNIRPFKVDLTEEKRFSLSPATEDLLMGLEDVVFVRVYLEGEFPAGFKRLRNATLDMLSEFKAYAGGNVEFEFYDPLEGVEGDERKAVMEQLAKEEGVVPTALIETQDGYSEKPIFPYAKVSYLGRSIAVPLLQEQLNKGPQETLNQSIALLEYQLANTIQKLQRSGRPSIAFLTGHGELPAVNIRDFAYELSRFYLIERVNITEQLYLNPKYDAVVIAQPKKHFDESQKFKIDQYIMNGGSVLWLVENLATHLDSLQNPQGAFVALDYNLNIEDLLFKYGVRVNFDVIEDLQATQIPMATSSDAFGNARQMQLFPWPYFPVVTNANPEHPITKNLDAVLFRFTGSIDTIQTRKAAIKKTVLLKTSPYSLKKTTPVKIDVNEIRQPLNEQQFNNGAQVVGVALEGVFPSAFTNRLAPETIKMIDTLENVSYRTESKPTKMAVFADGDLIKNDVDARTGRPVPLGYYRYTRDNFANKELLLNTIEWLTDDYGIIEARNKEVKLRLLDTQRIPKERLRWQLLNIALPISIVLLFGLIYGLLRRRRYGKQQQT